MKKRLFLILFALGMAGVLSFLLVDLPTLIALVPEQMKAEAPPISPSALKILSLIQPTILLAIAVLIGVRLANQVGLSAPFVEALASGQGTAGKALKPQIIPGVVGGLAGGGSIILVYLLCRPFLLPETVARIMQFTDLMPLPTRLLYGGITEELLLRWGFMTLLVWLAWRLFQRKRRDPSRATFIGAIAISSVMFGIGHLPIAFVLFPQPESILVVYVILANSLFGLIAGYLYWKKGLESAIVAHMCAHLVMITVDHFFGLTRSV